MNIFIFIFLICMFYSCGANKSTCILPNADLVLYQNGYGTNRCDYQKFKNEGKNIIYGKEVWTDVELRRWLTTNKCFTYDEVHKSIDDALTITDNTIGYSIDCVNDNNYDSRMKNIFICYSSNEKKLFEYPFTGVVIQYYICYDRNGQIINDNRKMINDIVKSKQFSKIYVGLYSYEEWYPDNRLPQLLKINSKLIEGLYKQYGNQITGIYIPQEFRVTSYPKALFQYFNALSKIAHSFGYKVAISPYCY